MKALNQLLKDIFKEEDNRLSNKEIADRFFDGDYNEVLKDETIQDETVIYVDFVNKKRLD